jgi:hypothetical protein
MDRSGMAPALTTAERSFQRALHCTALHCTALHCTALHCTAPHCPAQHRTAPHSTPPRSRALTVATVSPSAVPQPVLLRATVRFRHCSTAERVLLQYTVLSTGGSPTHGTVALSHCRTVACNGHCVSAPPIVCCRGARVRSAVQRGRSRTVGYRRRHGRHRVAERHIDVPAVPDSMPRFSHPV